MTIHDVYAFQALCYTIGALAFVWLILIFALPALNRLIARAGVRVWDAADRRRARRVASRRRSTYRMGSRR